MHGELQNELRNVVSKVSAGVRALGVGALGVGALGVVALVGCSIDYDYPDTAPRKDEVFAAARDVLQQRYPMSSSTEKYEQLFALTGVDLEGNSRSRKQISIYVSRNWIGAYEPTVAVMQYVEWSEPPLRLSDPGSDSPARTSLHPSSRWRPLQRLPMEEKAIYDAIMGKLVTSMAPPSAPETPAPETSASLPSSEVPPSELSTSI